MNIYNYHPATFEYLSTSVADTDPLDPDKHLIPANATAVEVPASLPNEAAIFSVETQTWSVVPDHRGQTMYDQTTGAAVTITELGALPSNIGNSIPASVSLQLAKDDKINKLAASYNDAIQLPVDYMSTTFQADENSQNVLTKSLVAGSVPSGFFWLDSNNMQVPMTFSELQGLAAAMLVQGQAAFAKLQTLKAQVRAATTAEDVGLVVW